MTQIPSRSNASRRTAAAFAVVAAAALLLVLTAFVAVDQARQPVTSSTSAVETGLNAEIPGAPETESPPQSEPESSADDGRGRDERSESPDVALTSSDGYIPDGTTLFPFDAEFPAISNLDRRLLAAIQSAAADARQDGVELVINSGWRSERYQQALLDEAIVTYGSESEALKWVSTPDRSAHVTGEAVDVGPTDADDWFIRYGSDYGLCQTYANEMWHFELAVEPGDTCPEPISDASAG